MFTVNDVKHYVYCPVIIHITHVLGINETETQYMALSKEIETKKAIASAIKLVNAIEIRRNAPVRFTRLGLSGTIDYANTNIPVPITHNISLDDLRRNPS